MAEEALVRFVASMYYALSASLAILLISWVFAICAGTNLLTIEPLLLIVYLLAIAGILINFRYLRAKEAAAFLSAYYAAQVATKEVKNQITGVDSDKFCRNNLG